MGDSHEATTAPAAQDTTLIVVFAGVDPVPLYDWARAVRTDAVLRYCPIIVVAPTESAAIARPSIDAIPNVSIMEVPAEATEDSTVNESFYSNIHQAVTTRFFIFSPRSRTKYKIIENLKQQISRGRDRVESIGLNVDFPLLLHYRYARRSRARAYIKSIIANLDETSDPALLAYMGLLSLATSTLSLEAIDPDQDHIRLTARVFTGRDGASEPPPWRYRLIVVSAKGNSYTHVPAELSKRVDNQGRLSWETLTAYIPVDDVPEGNLRIKIGIDTNYQALRASRNLRPRAGVLAPAREVTMRLPQRANSSDTIRYLVHTVRNGSQTWLVVQRGAGQAAERRWRRALIKKDVRHIFLSSAGRRMRAARLIRLLTAPLFRNREIWLIGEREDTAQDNGFHLFKHLRTTLPHRNVYYIIDRPGPHYARVSPLGNVVQHSSVKHRLLILHADVLANAYSVKHMIPSQWNPDNYTRHIAWRVGALRIYLKHGVNVSANSVKRGTGGYDIYLSVNPRETAALRETSGYGRNIKETGMPRYDALSAGPKSRTVLFMPTWRRYLVPKLFGPSDEALIPFAGSTYETFLHSFLSSPRLHQLLDHYDYQLQFLPHYNLATELTAFDLKSDRLSFADTSKTSFQDLITSCDVFITDYSSVHFDVAYIGTPVIYTHFDEEEYAAGHASVSWFEHQRDGFGPVVHTVDQAIDELDQIIANACVPEPLYQQRVSRAFTFKDRENSARVTQVIDDRLESLRPLSE